MPLDSLFIVLSKDSQLVDDGLCAVGERSRSSRSTIGSMLGPMSEEDAGSAEAREEGYGNRARRLRARILR